jgi:RNA-splicing ligase RtcB
MPDCHAGKGCVVGTTIIGAKAIIPNVVGVDVSCGMCVTPLPETLLTNEQFKRFDDGLRQCMPFGHRVHDVAQEIPSDFKKEIEVVCEHTQQDKDYVLRSCGSLGGGNHFVEIVQSKDGKQYLVIHTGSRNFGLKIATHHQSNAVAKSQGVPNGLEYLTGDEANLYLADMLVAKEYAKLNREVITKILLQAYYGSADLSQSYQCVHNYIGEDGTVRKGAISAKAGERLVIPLNMGAGVIFGLGKGCAEWNFSAPHGAGRHCSRNDIKKVAKLEDYQEAMKGIWSSSVSYDTIDEAPFAYKSPSLILDSIGDSVEVTEVCRPVYNFKAPENRNRRK